MAALQERNGSFRVLFYHNGKRETFTIGKIRRQEAESTSAQVDYLLMRLEQPFVSIPQGVDVVAFICNGGKAPEDGGAMERSEVTLAQFHDRQHERRTTVAWRKPRWTASGFTSSISSPRSVSDTRSVPSRSQIFSGMWTAAPKPRGSTAASAPPGSGRRS
jgi:hypothetical protein